MSVALLEYNPRHYDTLPPVIEASQNAEPSGAINALESVIGNVFVKHGVQNELGIILLHNHFDLSPTEILVQFGNSAVPWETSKNPDLFNVVPGAWRFVEEGLAPYEFVYLGRTKQSTVPLLADAKYGPFLAELLNLLQKHDLVDVLGLVALENKDVNSPPLVELEFGRSTIALEVDINPEPEDAWIHVVWQFGAKFGEYT